MQKCEKFEKVKSGKAKGLKTELLKDSNSQKLKDRTRKLEEKAERQEHRQAESLKA